MSVDVEFEPLQAATVSISAGTIRRERPIQYLLKIITESRATRATKSLSVVRSTLDVKNVARVGQDDGECENVTGRQLLSRSGSGSCGSAVPTEGASSPIFTYASSFSRVSSISSVRIANWPMRS